MPQPLARFGIRGALATLCVIVAVVLSGCPTPTPDITPSAGTSTCPQTVTIKDTNASAAIFYTTDGSTPTASSTRYTGPFRVSDSSTVKAIALLPGASSSDVASASFACVTASLARGEFAVMLQQRFNLPQPSRPVACPDVHPSDTIYSAVQAAAPFMDHQVLCPGCQLNVNFFPDEPVTRAISTIALVRVLVANGKAQLLNPEESETVLSNVSDAARLPRAARPYFATAIKDGILTLGTGNTIQPGLPRMPSDMVALMDSIQKQFNISTNPRQ
jgi:hypothetical protein